MSNKKQIISGYVNEVVGDRTDGVMKEKIVRVYNKDKKVLNREKIVSYLKKIMEKKKTNQNFLLRIYTDRGWRVIKKLSNDTINWQDEEEYLSNTKNPQASAYKEVYFVDVYTTTNMV